MTDDKLNGMIKNFGENENSIGSEKDGVVSECMIVQSRQTQEEDNTTREQ